MFQLKKGQRFLRRYTDGGGPTLILEIEKDSSNDSAQAKIIQILDLDKSPQHCDYTGLLVWAFLHPSWSGMYTYLEGQDAPQ